MSWMSEQLHRSLGKGTAALMAWLPGMVVLTALAATIADQKPILTEHDEAFWLNAQQVAFVRPGPASEDRLGVD